MSYQLTATGTTLHGELSAAWRQSVPMGTEYFRHEFQRSRTGEGLIPANAIQELWILHALVCKTTRRERDNVNRSFMSGALSIDAAQDQMNLIDRYPPFNRTYEQIGSRIPRPYRTMGLETYGYPIHWSYRLNDLVDSGFIEETSSTDDV